MGNRRKGRLTEAAVYRALGVEAFGRRLLAIERWRGRKDGYRNINYHLRTPCPEEAEAFTAYLYYNTSIHILGLMWVGAYFLLAPYLSRRVIVLECILLLLALVNLWCILLQRYHALRIAEVRQRYAAILRRRASRRAQSLKGRCTVAQAQTLLTGLRALRQQADLPGTLWTEAALLPLMPAAELIAPLPPVAAAEDSLTKRQLRVQRKARRLMRWLGKEKPTPAAADARARALLEQLSPDYRLRTHLDFRIAVLETFIQSEPQGGNIYEQ